MIEVTYLGNTYQCDTAIKGPDYVRLLDSRDIIIAAFEGVADFNAFTITNGQWTAPQDDNNCFIAVIRSDGTVGKSGAKLEDAVKDAKYVKAIDGVFDESDIFEFDYFIARREGYMGGTFNSECLVFTKIWREHEQNMLWATLSEVNAKSGRLTEYQLTFSVGDVGYWPEITMVTYDIETKQYTESTFEHTELIGVKLPV